MWENQLSGHQIRGWRAVSAAGFQGKGSPKRSVFLHRRRYGHVPLKGEAATHHYFFVHPARGRGAGRMFTSTLKYTSAIVCLFISTLTNPQFVASQLWEMARQKVQKRASSFDSEEHFGSGLELPCVLPWRPEVIPVWPAKTRLNSLFASDSEEPFGPDGIALRGALKARGP